MRVGMWRKRSAKELVLLNCVIGADSWQSFGLQGHTSIHPKGDQSWVFIGRTDVEAETPILWPPDAKSWFIEKDPDAGKDWRYEKKGTKGYEMVDGITDQWIWVWVNSGSWWRTRRPGVLRSMGSQRVGHDWATELNWTEWEKVTFHFVLYLLHILYYTCII